MKQVKKFSLVCDACGSNAVEFRWAEILGFLRVFITCKVCGAHEDAQLGILP
jgi:hypothetical protein